MGSRLERVIGHAGTENGPGSYGRQQARNLTNGRKSESATPLGGFEGFRVVNPCQKGRWSGSSINFQIDCTFNRKPRLIPCQQPR